MSSVAGREDERFQSPELQRKAIERWTKGLGPVRWLGWFEDLDVTGMTQRRPGLDQARELAKAHRADIVVYDLSRWARSVEGGLRDMRLLKRHGVEVLSASESIDPTSASGMFSLHIFLAAAEWYAATKADSWRGVIASNKSQGLWHGRVPYGYRRPTSEEAEQLGRTSGVIVPDVEAAKDVVWAFEKFVSGSTMFEVGVELVRRGVFKRNTSAVHMLRNPVYAGLIAVGREREPRIGVAEGYEGDVLEDHHGRPRWRYTGEPVLIEGFHAALIDPALWKKACKRHDEAKTLPPARVKRRNSGQPSWWGASLIRCGRCARALSRDVKPSGEYLTCQKRKADCGGVGSVRVDVLEPLLLEGLKELAAGLRIDPEKRALRTAAQAATAKERAAAEKALTAAENALARTYAEAIRNDTVSGKVMAKVLAEMNSDVAAATARLEALGEPGLGAEAIKAQARLANDLGRLWPKMTDEERRRALKSLSVQVVISPGEGRAAPLAGRVTLRTSF